MSQDLHETEDEARARRALQGGGGNDTLEGMEARVAVLEQIAKSNEKLLEKMDARMMKLEDRQHADFMWLLTLGLGATALILGTMAYGFHWL